MDLIYTAETKITREEYLELSGINGEFARTKEVILRLD